MLTPRRPTSFCGPRAVHYVEHHLGQVPVVVAARFGRAFGVFVPWQEIDLEWARIGRPRLPATIGLFAYYGLAVFAVGGAVVLRRRRVTLYPAVVILAEVALVAVAIFGQTRYRTPLDVVLVVLAAVAVDHLWQGRSGRARHAIKSAGAPSPQSPQPPPPPIPTAPVVGGMSATPDGGSAGAATA